VASALSLDGIPVTQLAARWCVPGVHFHARLRSSMDTAHELATAGAAGGTVVACEAQTCGRGRDGRTWHSPPGGVWIALVLRPPIAPPGAVAIRAGLAVASAVDQLLDDTATGLKWPNDVLLGERKLAGVLGESRWVGDRLHWMVVGVGVNVRNPLPGDVDPPAVALVERAPAVRRIDVLDRLIPELAVQCAVAGTLTAAECAAFRARDVLRDRLLRAPVVGRVRGIAPDGALLVETATSVVAVREGRVAPA